VERIYDLLVIGGGVNGAGIARDGAGRGLRVLLAERHDLGGATSSASTKLVHGGLRYLEHYEFRLVRESLRERAVLLGVAPHLVRPLRFVLPHEPHLRPAWLLRLGLLLYDNLGGRGPLPRSQALDLRADPAGEPLRPALTRGFSYADCRVDDARLVLANAMDAATRGATIMTRTEVTAARRDGALWRVTLRDDAGTHDVSARIVVNAAGPWVAPLRQRLLRDGPGKVKLVQGSHIVVPRLFAHDSAYIFQNADGRIVFAIPYEDDFTMIGTTDRPVNDADAPEASKEEIVYLCRAASAYFSAPITPAQAVWTFAGVRALYDDGASNPSAITRDYVLELDANGAPCLSVYGGKMTTYRKLAEQVFDRLAPHLPDLPPAWTADARLPGGETGDFAAFVAGLQRRFAALDSRWLERLAQRHGALADELLRDVRTSSDRGRDFGGGLYEIEARWCMTREWAREADDVLWRRSKAGLRMSEAQRDAFAAWFATVQPVRT
jgi:glycerol-3-phosphate dehydrogenase